MPVPPGARAGPRSTTASVSMAMGSGHDRHGPARWRAPARRDVLRVLPRSGRRSAWPCHPQTHSFIRADPRLGGPGRGRPDTPTGGAPASLRAMPGLRRGAPGRRQRDGAGMEDRGRGGRPGRLDPHPPGRARVARGTAELPPTRACGAAATSSPSSEGAPGDRPGRHGQRGAALHGGGPDPGGRGSVGGARSPSPVLGVVRGASPTTTGHGALPPGVLGLRSMEAASTFGWDRYADDAIGLDHFGASATGAVSSWGSSASPRTHVVERAHALSARHGG